MPSCEKASVKLTNSKLKILKSAAKRKTGKTLKIKDEELTHELFLTIRQKAERRNGFSYKIYQDLKLCKSQLPKIF